MCKKLKENLVLDVKREIIVENSPLTKWILI